MGSKLLDFRPDRLDNQSMSHVEHALHTFMAQVSTEMASEYMRIFARTAEDPGTAGDEGEENWATFLREWLPPSYHVATKGRLIGSDGTMSPQIDVLVLKPFYPTKLREKKVWLANGVAAAFECKTTLKAEHISDSADRCRKFKALFPRRNGSPEKELRSALIYGILAHSHAWNAIGSKPAENVSRALLSAAQSSSHPSESIDLLCLADVGSWSTMAVAYYEAAWNADPDLPRILGGSPWGVSTSMVGAALNDDQVKAFQPIGAMLGYLTQRLAWNDPAIRDLADYYRLAHLWGTGAGSSRFWHPSVYSDEVRRQVSNGRIKNDGGWNEWNVGIV